MVKKHTSPFKFITKIKLLLPKLSETENEWKPFSAELIPFETLFKSKYKGYL